MKVLTFGEMMLRLKPQGNNRIMQFDAFEAAYGGAEANVAVSLALLGNDSAYLTKLPENLLGETALSTLRKYGVDTCKVLRGGSRLSTFLKRALAFAPPMLFTIVQAAHLLLPANRSLIGKRSCKMSITSIFRALRRQFLLN
ncbi:MAG: PfkB family carbohydrate kinase [Symbiopectobacterium sp.]|uniref:PfkB family carbohydrate kinase n=1 Tax=Symbiopectobacterium sp. TaxID=2952789 RepID=UPI0039ED1892